MIFQKRFSLCMMNIFKGATLLDVICQIRTVGKSPMDKSNQLIVFALDDQLS